MNEAGTWETQVDLAPGQAYAYKFVNGNEWGLDESVPDSCGTPNGLGGFNRLWAFDTASTPGPTLVCWSSCTAAAMATVRMKREQVSAVQVRCGRLTSNCALEPTKRMHAQKTLPVMASSRLLIYWLCWPHLVTCAQVSNESLK